MQWSKEKHFTWTLHPTPQQRMALEGGRNCTGILVLQTLLRIEESPRLNKHAMIIRRDFWKIKHRYLSCVRKLDYAGGEECGNFITFASTPLPPKNCDKRNIILIIHRRWWFFIKNSSRRHFSCCWGIHLAYLRELLKKQIVISQKEKISRKFFPFMQIKF